MVTAGVDRLKQLIIVRPLFALPQKGFLGGDGAFVACQKEFLRKDEPFVLG
jgi:hypothetical protein